MAEVLKDRPLASIRESHILKPIFDDMKAKYRRKQLKRRKA